MEKWSDIEGVLPASIEEGKKYYKYYKEVHHLRNKRFAPDDQIKNKTSLACFARTGSNWFKYTLEELTGFYLADDHYAKDQTSIQWLISQGELLGMGKNSVLVKTHFPFVPNQRTEEEYSVNRVIVQTRNPINCIMSLFNLVVVDHHVSKLPSDFYLKDPVYDKIFRVYVRRWCQINEFWENQGIPFVCLRYEDLTENLSETLKDMYSFINGEQVRGTKMEKVIDAYVEKRGRASFYRKGVNETRNLYELHSKEQIRYIYETAKDYLTRFGYAEEYENFLGIPAEERVANRLQETIEENKRVIQGICSGEIKTEKQITLGDTTDQIDEEYEALRPEMMATHERLIEESKKEENKDMRKPVRVQSLDSRTAEMIKERTQADSKQNASEKNIEAKTNKSALVPVSSAPVMVLAGAFIYLFCL